MGGGNMEERLRAAPSIFRLSSLYSAAYQMLQFAAASEQKQTKYNVAEAGVPKKSCEKVQENRTIRLKLFSKKRRDGNQLSRFPLFPFLMTSNLSHILDCFPLQSTQMCSLWSFSTAHWRVFPSRDFPNLPQFPVQLAALVRAYHEFAMGNQIGDRGMAILWFKFALD